MSEQSKSEVSTEPTTEPTAEPFTDADVSIVMRPVEEAPNYGEWKAEQERLAAERAEQFAQMKAWAEAEVNALLGRYAEHNFFGDRLGDFYSQNVVPQSAVLLLQALIDEGRVEREEMQARQLVIQRLLLSADFQHRCTSREIERGPAGSGSGSDAAPPKRGNGLSLVKPAHDGGLIVPMHARRNMRNGRRGD